MSRAGFAAANGTRLYYEVSGSGHPLVLVHGFSLDTRMWDEQLDAFARRYQVIRYDVRGYGKSDVPGSNPYYHADDLAALLDQLDVQKAHVLGLSLGGAIAAEFVLAYPERASSFIAVDPVIWGYEWSPEYGASLGALWEAAGREGIEGARALWLKHPMFEAALEREGVARRLVQIVTEYSGWHWDHDDPGKLPERVAFTRLEEIDVPTLAIVGERDVPDFHTITGIMSARIRDARKVVLPGVGHMPNMEDPASFSEAVLGFLAEIEARQAD